ncbi:MAG: hypothetical protein U0794_01870 [Isosphaeraceae bacterium]
MGPFVLRPEHEKAFGDAGLRRYARRVRNWLRRDHAEPVARFNDAELLTRCERWVFLANGHGLKTETQIFRVCEAAAHLAAQGVDAATFAPLLALLADTSLDPETRSTEARAPSPLVPERPDPWRAAHPHSTARPRSRLPQRPTP